MPFRHYQFDPAIMDAMHAAFKEVCSELELACGPEDQVTEVVVEKIVALVRDGVREPHELARLVMEDLRRQPPQ